MGQRLHVIASLTDDRGDAVRDARLDIAVRDPSGELQAMIEASGDDEGVYRSPAWVVPHRTPPGPWTLAVTATAAGARGTATADVEVLPSTSEEILSRYGFWVDAPTLGGIVPSLVGEFGDADSGRLLWGGSRPGIHILPAAWLEIQWRQGKRPLADEEDVRRFFVEDLGRFGFTPIRALVSIAPTRFHDRSAWRVVGRGQFEQDQVEWVVFYAPEVDKTYAIGTTIVQPPPGVDAAAMLRDSFEVFPQVRAEGVAAQPLPDLLPAPELISPPLGTEFRGDEVMELVWVWRRPLADDEAYEVRVDYNYQEANPQVVFKTRQARLTLPASLFAEPNCGVFNWKVKVVRSDAAEGAQGAVSHDSFYSFLRWSYPPGETAPYPSLCPNAQE
jgi:hypothetical protein